MTAVLIFLVGAFVGAHATYIFFYDDWRAVSVYFRDRCDRLSEEIEDLEMQLRELRN